jgi:signal transduction histidine kinase
MGVKDTSIGRWLWACPHVGYAVGAFALGSVLLVSGVPPVLTVMADPPVPASDPVRLIPLAVICAAELLRYRALPLGLVVGIGVVLAELPMGVSFAVILVFCDLLYSATLYSGPRLNRVIVVGVGVLIVAAVVTSVMLGHDWRENMLLVVQICTIPLIPVWWATTVRQQRREAETQRSRADQLATIAELDRRAAVSEERSRMARDLHDVIAGHLSVIAIQSEAALSMVDDDRATTLSVLKSVRENSVASLIEMRAMIGLLRSDRPEQAEPCGDPGFAETAPPRLRDLGLLVDSARAAGLEVGASTEIEGELSAAVDLSAYRIVQEALTNAVKHTPGGRVDIRIGCRGRTLVVEVTSDGDGARRAPADGQHSGKGLLTMRERAQAVGGTLVAGPEGSGWRVRAELPLGDAGETVMRTARSGDQP